MKIKTKLSLMFMCLSFFYFSPVNAGCDACMQAAATSADTQIKTGLQNVEKSAELTVKSTDAVKTALDALETSMKSSSIAHTERVSKGLQGIAAAIQTSYKAFNELQTRISKHAMDTIVETLEQSLVSDYANERALDFDESVALPMSAEVGVQRAKRLRDGYAQSNQMWSKFVDEMAKWNDGSPDDVSRKRTESLNKEDAETWDIMPLLTKSQITEKESKDAQKLITILVNPDPLRQSLEGKENHEYDLKRKLHNAKLGIVHSVLAKSISERMELVPISEKNWAVNYVTAYPGKEGMTSVLSALESDTLGKLVTPEWYVDINTKSRAGVLREQVFQQAINNQILLKMLEQEEQKLTMLALLAASAIEENRPRE